MKHPRIWALILSAVWIFTGCQSRELGTQAIVDMLEVNYTDKKVSASVEYRILGEKDGPVKYSVYQGEGDTLWQALGEIESKNLVTLYMDNCKVVNIMGDDNKKLEEMILQTDQLGSIRPQAWITTSTEPMLKEGEEQEISVYQKIQKMFYTHGGTLGNRFTLKDGVVSQKEKDIPNMLPMIEQEKVKEIKIWKDDRETALEVEKAILLPIADILTGKWRVYLKENQCEIFLDNLYLVNWVEDNKGEKVVHLEIMPTYSIVNGNQYDIENLEKELYQMIETATRESMEQISIPLELDLYSIKKVMKIMKIENETFSQIKYEIDVKNFF